VSEQYLQHLESIFIPDIVSLVGSKRPNQSRNNAQTRFDSIAPGWIWTVSVSQLRSLFTLLISFAAIMALRLDNLPPNLPRAHPPSNHLYLRIFLRSCTDISSATSSWYSGLLFFPFFLVESCHFTTSQTLLYIFRSPSGRLPRFPDICDAHLLRRYRTDFACLYDISDTSLR